MKVIFGLDPAVWVDYWRQQPKKKEARTVSIENSFEKVYCKSEKRNGVATREQYRVKVKYLGFSCCCLFCFKMNDLPTVLSADGNKSKKTAKLIMQNRRKYGKQTSLGE